MSGKVTQFKKTQKYRFDFGTDEKLHTAIFNAKIPNAQLEELLYTTAYLRKSQMLYFHT